MSELSKETKKGRVLALGDVHGAHKALVQVLERSNFDYENDTLICLGDVADGWPEVPQCFTLLAGIPKLIYVLGNHDEWFREWYRSTATMVDHLWIEQGGRATYEAYGCDQRNVPESHRKILDKARDFYVLDDRCYVHGGLPLDGGHPIMATGDELRWDRSYWMAALRAHALLEQDGHDTTEYNLGTFKEVFIGHTATTSLVDDDLPVRALNVWNLDQGAGWSGKLTIMDVETKEFWQSDFVTDLYPGVRGRARKFKKKTIPNESESES
jgi:serine/threonine protein phosphatase 1